MGDNVLSAMSTVHTEFGLLETADLIRADADQELVNRQKYAQYLTPASVARLMASLIDLKQQEIRLFDPGAGTGLLTAAAISALVSRTPKPTRISASLFEIDSTLYPQLQKTLMLCRDLCKQQGVEFDIDLLEGDFLDFGIRSLRDDLFFDFSIPRFNLCVTNPPYKKMSADSEESRSLQALGINAANLYSSFVGLALRLLDTDGLLVAITPRSFCNGSYFKKFREELTSFNLERVHLFESRTEAFEQNDVLQENIIFACRKSKVRNIEVEISSSDGPELRDLALHVVPWTRVIDPNDPEKVIHLELSESASLAAAPIRSLPNRLADLGLQICTGQVVDFRLTRWLLADFKPDSVPLLYPAHFRGGVCNWPQVSKKSNAIQVNSETERWLMPAGQYVVMKRFTSKEEKRRLVAFSTASTNFPTDRIAFENHLNVIHQQNGPIRDGALLNGVWAYLNSTIVDSFFRQFSGHTQVNAADIRRLPFPEKMNLLALGDDVSVNMAQDEIDGLVIAHIFKGNRMAKKKAKQSVSRIRRLKESLDLLKQLDLPREQQNERTALTLMALAGVDSEKDLSRAEARILGITPIMEFMRDAFGKKYAPNTRETVRRFSVHQLVQSGLLVQNPDKIDRPPNSPKTVYQLDIEALNLVRSYGTRQWNEKLATYRKTVVSLRERYARERTMARIPVRIGENKQVSLSPGGQNHLVKQILEEFAERFTPGGRVLYVGDTDQKFAHFDEASLAKLDVTIEKHGKMPDVIIHFVKKGWLVLVEAVTSHGPISAKRREELQALFAKSKAGLVYVTAFSERSSMTRYLRDISWATEVWVAESPSHLIHFNGERFLGPYSD